jgi:hypothetical protein
MKLDFFMLADEARVDDQGKLSIQGGGVTHLRAPELPFVLDSLAIVVRFFYEGDEEEKGVPYTLQVLIADPDGIPFRGLIAHLEPSAMKRVPTHEGEDSTLLVFGKLPELEVEREGRYTISLSLDETPIAERSVVVILEQAANADRSG